MFHHEWESGIINPPPLALSWSKGNNWTFPEAPEFREIMPVHNAWIPAFAGMTTMLMFEYFPIASNVVSSGGGGEGAM